MGTRNNHWPIGKVWGFSEICWAWWKVRGTWRYKVGIIVHDKPIKMHHKKIIKQLDYGQIQKITVLQRDYPLNVLLPAAVAVDYDYSIILDPFQASQRNAKGSLAWVLINWWDEHRPQTLQTFKGGTHREKMPMPRRKQIGDFNLCRGQLDWFAGNEVIRWIVVACQEPKMCKCVMHKKWNTCQIITSPSPKHTLWSLCHNRGHYITYPNKALL